jgi:hypothetical protein
MKDAAYEVRANQRNYTMAEWSDALRLRFEDHFRKAAFKKLESGKKHLSREEYDSIKRAIPEKYASGSAKFAELSRTNEGEAVIVWLRLRPATPLDDVRFLLASNSRDFIVYSDEERKERKDLFQKLVNGGGLSKGEEKQFLAVGGKQGDITDAQQRRQNAQQLKPAPTLAERVALLERRIIAPGATGRR